MPNNTCIPLFKDGDDLTGRVITANVVGKTFGVISGLESGPGLTFPGIPGTYSGGNLQVSKCPAGAAADCVFAYDQVVGEIVPLLAAHGSIVPVSAGAAITAGQDIEVDAAGKAIPLAAGKRVAKAVTAAASGADVFVRLYF